MPLRYFWTYLTKNANYGVAKDISLNLDMALRFEMSED